MSNRILFCTAEGIGNVLQTIPVIRTLKEVLGYKVDLWHAFGSFNIPKLIPYIDRWFSGGEISHLKTKNYIGLVSTTWTKKLISQIDLKQLTGITPFSMDRSEVDVYMDIARELGAKEDQLLWHGNCVYNEDVQQKFDVVKLNSLAVY